MKKLILALLITISSSVTVFAYSSEFGEKGVRYFGFHECNIEHIVGINYTNCIHLIDGSYLLSFEEDELKYLQVFKDGTTKEVKTNYRVYGQNKNGYYIISSAKLASQNFDGIITDVYIDKYGIADKNGKVILEPILDIVPNYYIGELVSIEIDNNEIKEHKYGATEYSFKKDGLNFKIPQNSKNILINKDYKVWEDYDIFYDNFITEDRFIIKEDGKSILIDSDMNIITDKYTHIIELDDGKWYASTDTSQTAPIYSIVLDNDGNEMKKFNPKFEKEVSSWAKPYIHKADELGITIRGETTAFNTSFFKEEITRIEFCRIVVNTLKALEYKLPEITDNDIFIDTKDENVLLCSKLGLIDGVGNGEFAPYTNLTREQAAKILISLASVLEIDTSKQSDINKFIDLEQAAQWSKEYILKVNALEDENYVSIMAGTSSNVFSPKSYYTVEQAIATLVRVSSLVQK